MTVMDKGRQENRPLVSVDKGRQENRPLVSAILITCCDIFTTKVFFSERAETRHTIWNRNDIAIHGREMLTK